MPINEILENQSVVTCREDQTLRELATIMKENDVGAVLVTRDNEPIGLTTDRDIALRCVAEGRSADECQVRDVMTQPVVTAEKSEGIHTIIDKMSTSQCRRIVIVDEQQNPVGLLSAGDLFKLLVQELSMLAKVLTPDQEKIRRPKVA
jgi:CBS domain-containing protein